MSIKVSAQEYAVLSIVAMAVQNPYLISDFEVQEREVASLSLDEAEALNQTVLNSGAGVFAKAPYSEWVNPKDKSKKSIEAFESVISDVGIAHAEFGDQPFSYQDIMKEMSMAMAINVGTGYNMASALTAAACLMAHNASVIKETISKLELITRKGWDLVYEDLTLSQDYKRGNPFYTLLTQSVSGCQTIPPSTPDGKWERKSEAETLQKIQAMFQDATGATGATLSATEAKWLIWARRVVAGYKTLNRKGLESFFKVRHFHQAEPGKDKAGDSNLVSLFPESKANSMLPDIVFVGIFRQLGQGTYGVADHLEDDGDAQSVWGLYSEYRDLILPYLPAWMSRKFEVSATVWLQMVGQCREERQVESRNYDGTSGYQLDVPDDDFDGIPYIDLHNCHAKSPYASGSIGAFETKLWACPIVPVAMANGNRLREATAEDLESGIEIKYFPQKAETSGFECKVVGDAYWYYRNLSAKEIMQRAEKRYPNGVILVSENNKAVYQYINFGALLKFGAFAGSDSATGLSLRLVQLIVSTQAYPENRPSGWDSSAAGILMSIMAGVRGMVNLGENADTSKRSKIIRLIGRSSSSKGSYATKVMTSCARRVQDHRFTRADGSIGRIPVIVLNPNDDVVVKGGFKPGDIMAVGRTPMISVFFAYVKLDESVSIGNAEVRASVFKAYTSGDGDGDPMGGINVSVALR